MARSREVQSRAKLKAIPLPFSSPTRRADTTRIPKFKLLHIEIETNCPTKLRALWSRYMECAGTVDLVYVLVLTGALDNGSGECGLDGLVGPGQAS